MELNEVILRYTLNKQFNYDGKHHKRKDEMVMESPLLINFFHTPEPRL